MKQKRNILLLFAILLALVIIYAALSTWNKSEEMKEKEQAAEDTVKLADADSLTELKYTNGESTMDFVKEDDTWYYKDDKTVSLDQDTVENLADTVTGLNAERELKNPDNLTDYGLSEPSYTVWYTSGGETVPIYIGNMTGEDYYATVGDTGKVYTITDDLVYLLEFDLDNFKDTSDTASEEE